MPLKLKSYYSIYSLGSSSRQVDHSDCRSFVLRQPTSKYFANQGCTENNVRIAMVELRTLQLHLPRPPSDASVYPSKGKVTPSTTVGELNQPRPSDVTSPSLPVRNLSQGTSLPLLSLRLVPKVHYALTATFRRLTPRPRPRPPPHPVAPQPLNLLHRQCSPPAPAHPHFP